MTIFVLSMGKAVTAGAELLLNSLFKGKSTKGPTLPYLHLPSGLVLLQFYVPPIAMVKWRLNIGFKSHPKDSDQAHHPRGAALSLISLYHIWIWIAP